ncbi:MAG: hypothetical protein SVR08_12820 [Spirochaetota bacterium]|nr:hypothetical protein [Spirochaetota bacterium]
MSAPYRGERVGTISSKSKGLNSFSGSQYTLGYFFDQWQTEFSYYRYNLKNQEIEEPDQDSITNVTGYSSFLELKIGYRLNHYGDTSFGWLYISGKRMSFHSDISDTNIKGTGYTVGYYRFYSIGYKSDIEFVFNYDAFLGVYKKCSFSSNADLEEDKKASLTLGASIGIGAQYEPYNITFLLKAAPVVDHVIYEGEFNGNDIDLNSGAKGVCFGFEIIFLLPNEKYNIRK